MAVVFFLFGIKRRIIFSLGDGDKMRGGHEVLGSAKKISSSIHQHDIKPPSDWPCSSVSRCWWQDGCALIEIS